MAGIIRLKSKVELCINEHGRKIAVESKGRGVIEINEYGNGVVSTHNKNGYRQ